MLYVVECYENGELVYEYDYGIFDAANKCLVHCFVGAVESYCEPHLTAKLLRDYAEIISPNGATVVWRIVQRTIEEVLV